jgi:hypothetical protein
LEPIKAKYGDALTWGDLIVLAGERFSSQYSSFTFRLFAILGFCARCITLLMACNYLGSTPEPASALCNNNTAAAAAVIAAAAAVIAAAAAAVIAAAVAAVR